MKLALLVVKKPIESIWHDIGNVESVTTRSYCDRHIWNYVEDRMGLEYSDHTDNIHPWGETELGDFESAWGI